MELPHKDGHMAPAELIATLLLDEAGRPRQLLGISRDITERKAAEQAIRQMAFHDPLTTLPNQRLLEDRLHQVIARAQRDHSRMSLLFIDLDKFKQVNDMRGHATGDWLLQRVAERMQNCLRESDTAARIGGDEFVVLLPDAETAQSALAVAEKIRATLEEPFVTPDGAALHISSSIGIAIYPDHADTPRDLLRFGDEAMYRAKKGGRNAVEVFAAAAPAQNSRPVIRVMWQPAYACGEPSIDEEHKELFRRANTLLDLAVKHEADPPAVNQAFDELLAHVTAHFAHEEAVLRDHDYEALSRHADQHRVLLEHAQDLRRQAAEGMLPVGELIDFIASKVVVGHMLKEDSRFHGLFTHAPRPNRSRNRTV
ncbi:diguanylate cyclase domain-containing protein [Methylogaea oryzae]|uniref:diguanylate cyclase domain-containing protein n=1 Tax=Methylogaea oryzae TaxID=1295382 RepID=UPI0009E98B25|nr:diguanylate cyclase [Methylogaea oryzae]